MTPEERAVLEDVLAELHSRNDEEYWRSTSIAINQLNKLLEENNE